MVPLISCKVLVLVQGNCRYLATPNCFKNMILSTSHGFSTTSPAVKYSNIYILDLLIYSNKHSSMIISHSVFSMEYRGVGDDLYVTQQNSICSINVRTHTHGRYKLYPTLTVQFSSIILGILPDEISMQITPHEIYAASSSSMVLYHIASLFMIVT